MSFSGQIAGFNKKAKKNALNVLIGTSFSLFASVVKLTPVDTGRLRNNWQITPNIAIGRKVIISNNLPYAQVIEDGHSKQAPNGMVKVTVTMFDSFVKAAARGVK